MGKRRSSEAVARPVAGKARAGRTVHRVRIAKVPGPPADEDGAEVARVLPAPGSPMSEAAMARAKAAAATARARATARPASKPARGQADPSAPLKKPKRVRKRR